MLDCLCLFVCLSVMISVCVTVYDAAAGCVCHHDSLADTQQCLYAQDFSQSALSESKHIQTHTYMTHFRHFIAG